MHNNNRPPFVQLEVASCCVHTKAIFNKKSHYNVDYIVEWKRVDEGGEFTYLGSKISPRMEGERIDVLIRVEQMKAIGSMKLFTAK